ncbi:large ribosomal subunit protein mL37-like [Montipora capricornis]
MAAFIPSTRENVSRFLRSFLTRKGHTAAEIQPYVYHPQSRVLEPETQSLYLTKTLQMGSISKMKCLQDNVIDRTIRREMMEKFRQNVIQTRLFNYEGEHATRDMCAIPLMQNMLRVVWSYAGSFPKLMETSLTYKPRVSVSYKRHETDLMISGNLGFLLSSKYPLEQVKEKEAIQSTEQVELQRPDIISPVFNLNKAKTAQKLDTGFFDGAPFPNPHTLVIVSTNQNWTTSDLVAQGIMFSFGRLAAEALNQGASLGGNLEKPLTTQCIATDGIRLSFLCYQLNTLDLENDDGIKNMVWITPGVFMYVKPLINEIPGTKKKDPPTYDVELQGFDDNCFETFVKMIINGCQES